MLSRMTSNRRPEPVAVVEAEKTSGMPARNRASRSIATIDEEKPLADQAGRDNRKRASRKSTSNNGGRKAKSALASGSASPSSSSLQSPSRPQEGRAAKKVHWYHKVEKKRHHRLQDLRPEEKEAVWYTENDTKIILAMAKVTVKMMMKGEPCDDVDYCSRGLEGKTPVGSKRRQKNKLRVRKALLEEQEIQREEGVFDPEYLSQVSIKYSADVVKEAHNTALKDERHIQDYLSIQDEDSLPIPPTRIRR